MRTPEEIDTEIKALEACKAYIPRLTTFGEDNHAHVDTMIAELRGEIVEDETTDEWNERSEREQQAILDARAWKNEDEYTKPPSSGWDHFKPKPKAVCKTCRPKTTKTKTKTTK